MKKFKYGVGGFFVLERYKADTGDLVERSAPCKNLVVGTGLDALMGRYGAIPLNVTEWTAAVGAGNSPPDIADQSLQSFLAGTNTTVGAASNTAQTAVAPFYSRKVIRWRFNQGVATGNVAELAVTIGNSVPNASTPIYARALVLDGAGNPTVISVQPDEFLDLIYTHDIYCPADLTGSCVFTIDGAPSAHDYIVRGSSLENNAWNSSTNTGQSPFIPGANTTYVFSAAYDGNINASVTGQPAGTRSPADSASSQPYVNGTYQRACSISFGLNYANYNIRSIWLEMGSAKMQIQYDPVIPKTSAHQMRFDYIISVSNYEGT